jgi:hypothetical protein
LARGAHSSGAIDIVAFESEHGDAVVQINATYDDYTTMKEARVCSLKKGNGHGVGLFVSLICPTSQPGSSRDSAPIEDIPTQLALASTQAQLEDRRLCSHRRCS